MILDELCLVGNHYRSSLIVESMLVRRKIFSLTTKMHRQEQLLYGLYRIKESLVFGDKLQIAP